MNVGIDKVLAIKDARTWVYQGYQPMFTILASSIPISAMQHSRHIQFSYQFDLIAEFKRIGQAC